VIAMSAELSNPRNGVPERFDPVEMRGDLVEAEHRVRYAWAASLVAGRKVLDAGCGLGYGAAMLARAGATVTGVDIAEAVIEAGRPSAGPQVDLQVGDVRSLAFDDRSFDVVVCFEVVEHIDERDAVLAELRRVLVPGGLLLVSSPNRDVYVPGNPHHVYEFTPEELREWLARSFANVALSRQHDWIASAVLDDAAFAGDDLDEVPGLRTGKVAGVEPGGETYTLAVATDGELPAVPAAAMLTGTLELRRWMELYDEQQAVLWRQNEFIEGLGDQHAERAELRKQLRAAEREMMRIAELEQERDEALGIAYQRQAEVDGLLEKIAECQATVDQKELALRAVVESSSWRLTAPLRKLMQRLR
jgi:O-antigen biosynthesis protein